MVYDQKMFEMFLKTLHWAVPVHHTIGTDYLQSNTVTVCFLLHAAVHWAVPVQ